MSHPFITHLKKDHEKQHRLGEQLTKATDPQPGVPQLIPLLAHV